MERTGCQGGADINRYHSPLFTKTLDLASATVASCIQDIYHRRMRFKHDSAKGAANLKKHGVAFADAEGVLEDPLAVTVEDPDAEGEQRFVTVGLGNAGELLVLVWTERDGQYRPISARRPTRKERKQYEG